MSDQERIYEIERRLEELSRTLADVATNATQAAQSAAMVWGDLGGGGGGGAVGAYYCNSIPAIAGLGHGTGDVYKMVGGSGVLLVSGATIYNMYASATTAGRVCTLADCGDGTYLILAQSCT